MPVNLAYQGYKLLWEALDWLFPPDCGGCGSFGARWCTACALNTLEVQPPICPVCGDPNINENLCQKCQSSLPFYSCLRSYTVFSGPIRDAIHKLKYRRDIGLGEALSRHMIDCLLKLNWPVDIVTSVPLGLVRFKERGYNQATLLALPIALRLQLPFTSRALTRIRETRSQVGLTLTERQHNMDDAFRANSNVIKGRKILVVDDVATSGATLNACARALLDGGASKVYGFSLARAVFNPNIENGLS